MKNRRTSATLGFALSACTAFSAAFADDTEVFFGQTDPSMNIYPNVLFVLDTSGSMTSTDGTNASRLQRMKDALHVILDSSANINVGLMRFNGSAGGGAVLYPVTPIDQQVCADANCGDVALSSRIGASTDDAEESLSSESVSLNGNALSMGDDFGTGDEQAVGLRFTELNIPQGATITSAVVEFTAYRYDSTNTQLDIRAEIADDSATFANASKDITDRNTFSQKVNWNPENWYTGETYKTPDLTTIVQKVVDQSGWCGGNGMTIVIDGNGSRSAKSYDYSPTEAPILKLTYDASELDAGEGCMRKTVVAAVGTSSDDAEEYIGSRNVSTSYSDLRPANRSGDPVIVGVRFQDLAIPAGADIDSASIQFEVDRQRYGSVDVKIEGEDTDNAGKFRSWRGNLSGRPTTSASTMWTNLPTDGTNSKISTPDVSAIVSEIVSRPGWSAGNSMAFLLKRNAGSGYRELESYDGEPSAAAKLLVTYRYLIGGSSSETFITARDKMKEEINNLNATGGTPIVDAYYEAANYYLGRDIDYGTQRGVYTHRWHRVSNPLSYTGGAVQRDYRCTDADPDSSYCTYERITGSPTYISPLASSCQTNHIVFLSDGEPTSISSVSKVKALTGKSSCTGSGVEQCGRELAEWLDTTDHNATIAGTQNISTYTIGFNVNSSFLQALAEKGGGGYYQASSAADLVDVFQTILGDVLSVDTSFVAPGATVNQFNRLTHRDDIYFAVFKPDQRPRWNGNLKRYRMGIASGGTDIEVLDSQGQPAVDPNTGFFADNSRSWWLDANASADGNLVAKGGAANQLALDGIPGVGDRRVYTYTGDPLAIPASGVDLTSAASQVHEDNAALTAAMLQVDANLSAGDQADLRELLLKWARGVDVNDVDEDDDTTDIRRHIGDPMHSRPVIVNYADGGNAKSQVFVATNEGYLHAVDTDTGAEQFAFMPQEVLPNIQDFYNNQSSTKHPYGLDGTVSVWHDDVNGNVMIDPGEEAYLYVGMRRGGNSYYAIDISTRNSPKFAWQVTGGVDGTPGYEELGETWSAALPTTIRFQGTERQVVIFAAGYDTNQDPDISNLAMTQDPDTIGRGLFIADARTGELIWSALGTSDGDQQFAAMQYSMPGNLRVVDIDYDGFADQIYAGDMGGQIWRFDFVRYHSSGNLLQGGVMAKLSGTASRDFRRFYNEPDVALVTEGRERFLSISIGSGWRAHPLDRVVDDRFYMLKSRYVHTAPPGYGKLGSDGNWAPITEADLTDVTDDPNHPQIGPYGWFFELEKSGEKVLGPSLTFNNQIIFASYQPDTSVGACSTAIGSGAVYTVSVLDASPTIDMDKDGDLDKGDRDKQLVHGGIPPEPTILITEDGPAPPMIGPEQLKEFEFDNLSPRTFWADVGD